MTEPRGGSEVTVPKKDPWMEGVYSAVEKRTDTFLDLLGSEAAVNRFKAVALHAIVQDSKLRQCDVLSIVEAVRESAVLGLEPTGVLGEAWLIPRGRRATLAIGWQGYLKLVRNSGQVAAIDTQVVYEKDIFEVEQGTDAFVRHVPYLVKDKTDTRGNYIGAYAWAKLNNGQLLVEWMNVADIEKVREFSEAKRGGPWFDFWGEMARKSVLRRFIKRLAKSPQLTRAIELDDEEQEPVQMTATTGSSARRAALQALEARHPEPEPDPIEIVPEPVEVELSEEEIDRLVEP